MRTIIPPGIALMSAILKESGFNVDVFDATRYTGYYTNPDDDYDTSHEKFNRMDKKSNGGLNNRVKRMDIHSDRVKNSNVLPFNWGDRNITVKTTNLFDDFRKKIENYDPDIVAFSIVENTFKLGVDLLSVVPVDIPVIFGGVFATYAPEKVLAIDKIDYACRGEGEYPLLDLCKAIVDNERTDNIPNIWCKNSNGNLIKNPMRMPIDINNLPFSDYSIFDKQLFFTPMQGKVWKAVGFETQRGCPYTCTYCNSPTNNVIYSEVSSAKFYRKKSVKTLKKELDYLVRQYDPELIYFVADTFLAMSKKELDEFSEFYQDYKLPFWMNTRAETITEHSARHLADMNCLRFNIGIEHGNERFCKKVLNRKTSNKKIIQSFQIAADYKDEFTCVANSIIGLPTETVDLSFDTIELNRQLPEDIIAAGAFVFAPFHGTPLRELAQQKGYIDGSLICTEGSNTSGGSLLNMPHYTSEQIAGMMRTFSFYVKFPKERWPEIDRAREFSIEGNEIFNNLSDEYSSEFFNPLPINKKVE